MLPIYFFRPLSCRIVDFAVSHSPDSMLTTKALKMSYNTGLKPSSVLFHSDQEKYYTSKNTAEASTSIIDYIWVYYQTVTPHLFNNYLPPVEKERCYFNESLLIIILI